MVRGAVPGPASLAVGAPGSLVGIVGIRDEEPACNASDLPGDHPTRHAAACVDLV